MLFACVGTGLFMMPAICHAREASSAMKEKGRHGVKPGSNAGEKTEQNSTIISGSGADIEMMDIPGGSFQMGCSAGDDDCRPNERPQHAVNIKPFRMSKYPITFAQWDACVASHGCSLYTPSDAGWGRGNRPVINVSWDDARQFVDWVNRETGRHFRLPSEAEWEYAARGGKATRYYWGSEIGSNQANCNGCGSPWDNKQTAPVDSFKPNAFGLFGMLGNIKQWTGDCWNNDHQDAPIDGSARTSSDCDRRVARGGPWSLPPEYLRASFRSGVLTIFRTFTLGFRLAEDR